MKRIYLIFSVLFIARCLGYSQFSKEDLILDLSGSYVESVNSSGVTMSALNGKSKTLDITFSAGYSISNAMILGIGVEYANAKDFRDYSFNYYNNFALTEHLNIKSNVIAPLVYMKYYKKASDRLFFGANLNACYGFVNSKYDSDKYGMSASTNESGISLSGSSADPFQVGYSHSENSTVLSIALQPELNYFLTEKLGVRLKLGGVGYHSYDFKEHAWDVNFNPSNWTYGLFLRLGK